MNGNNFSIVQTAEDDDVFLSVLPSRWVQKNGWKNEVDGNGPDLCYWPKGVAGYRLLEKAKKDPSTPPDTKVLRAYQCRIKRNNFAAYAEAFRELKLMEMYSDTDEYEPRKKLAKSTAAAELFNRIQFGSGTSRSISTTESAQNQRNNNLENIADLEDSFAEPIPKNTEHASNYQSLSNIVPDSKKTTPMIRRAATDDSTVRELVLQLHDKTDKNAKQIESLQLLQKKNAVALSQLNAKLDMIATRLSTQTPNQNVQVKSEIHEGIKVPLASVNCLADMESLEKQSEKEEFVQSVVQYLGSMHGKHRYVGEGTTVCLKIVDYFFDREFLMNCSWSGVSRNKENDNIISKIAFHKFTGIIDMFHKVVLFSDPTFSKVQCEKFLHQCLRNAKQRFTEVKGVRTAVARKRNKQRILPTVDDVIDGEADEIIEEYVMETESSVPPPPYHALQGSIDEEGSVIVEGYLIETE